MENEPTRDVPATGGGPAGRAAAPLPPLPPLVRPPLAGLSADDALALLGGLGTGRRGGTEEYAGIRYRRDDGMLYGVVDVDEAGFAAGPLALQRATEDVYRRIFALLDRHDTPHLWRAWNYIADINLESGGLERYRQFNIGRHDAFLASGRAAGLASGNLPAASALGTAGGPMVVVFMAGARAPIAVENPRQLSAYRYPSRYGPRSPTFSRAVLAHPPGRELLLISGTASIVGHETLHLGDVAGQTREAIANIEALLASASRKSLTAPYRLPEPRLRVYVRHAPDLARVQTVVESAVGTAAAIEYVEADICRTDLLVEIEAIASRPMGRS